MPLNFIDGPPIFSAVQRRQSSTAVEFDANSPVEPASRNE